MRKKVSIYFLSSLLILFSCGVVDKCTQAQINAEINNGNTDPKTLIVELNHNVMISAFDLAFNKSGCTGVGNGAAAKGNKLNCDVEFNVYTASLVNGSIVPDNNAYYSKTRKDQVFTSTALGNGNYLYQIEVPETGAFMIEYIIKSNDCNQCCNGPKPGCGFTSASGKCKEGKPSIMMRNIFTSTTRPPIEQNLIPDNNGNRWGTKACNDCDTCPEKNCY